MQSILLERNFENNHNAMLQSASILMDNSHEPIEELGFNASEPKIVGDFVA